MGPASTQLYGNTCCSFCPPAGLPEVSSPAATSEIQGSFSVEPYAQNRQTHVAFQFDSFTLQIV